MRFSLNTSRYSKNVPCVVLLEGRVSFPEVLVVVKAGLEGWGWGVLGSQLRKGERELQQ